MKHGLALCAGVGGLELALRDAFGIEAACFVERDAFAAATLMARMADGSIARAPIWDDLRTFDARAWRGRVDWLSAGYPCQPFSLAGKRAGAADPRHLWPDVRRCIEDSGVRVVFIENVPGHLSLGLADVLADLAALGFDAEWGVLGAHDVGAPHRRERLWVLAYSDRSGLEGLRLGGLPCHGDAQCRHDVDGRDGAAARLADAASNGWLTRRAECTRLEGRPSTPFGGWPPAPDDRAGWERLPAEAQPAIRGEPDGLPSRVDRLRALGNAVVPACASAAFRLLHARALNQ